MSCVYPWNLCGSASGKQAPLHRCFPFSMKICASYTFLQGQGKQERQEQLTLNLCAPFPLGTF